MKRNLKNVTVTLDPDAARWARIEAARRDTSVSRLLGEILSEKMELDREYEAAMHRYLAQAPAVHRRPGQRYPGRDDVHARDSGK
jgi:hypothetical protein